MQRFLGKAFQIKKLDEAKNMVSIALFLICIGIAASSIAILVVHNWIHDIFNFDLQLILIAILFVGSSALSMLFRSVVIASLKTRSLPIIIISSSIVKLILAAALLLMGTGAVGLTIGFTSNHILSSILLGVFVMRTIFKSTRSSNLVAGFITTSKSILVSSIVFWIPMLITTIGSQLGTIVVFGSQGADQAGVYFLTLTIVTGITNIMNSLFTIALPALSGLRDHRKRFAWLTIRFSALMLLPFTCSLIFYSKEIMGLFGQNYVSGIIIPRDTSVIDASDGGAYWYQHIGLLLRKLSRCTYDRSSRKYSSNVTLLCLSAVIWGGGSCRRIYNWFHCGLYSIDGNSQKN